MRAWMQPELAVEVVKSTAGLEAARPGWERLYDAATSGTNPFLRWAWVWHWWRSVERRGGWPRTRLYALLMRDAHDEIRAAVPFFLGSWGVGNLAFRALRLYGFHTTLT